MYSITGYGSMIADQGRMEAYRQALQQAIQPGAVVLDIGTGPGIFALLACQAGASRVYAIEPNEMAIQVARSVVAANGYQDKVRLIQALSTETQLPELVDVIISDLRGLLPYFMEHIPAIVDARQRFLAPGGVLIPQQDVLWAALVEDPDRYDGLVAPWERYSYGFVMTPARQIVTNACYKARFTPAQLLTTPEQVTRLDYATVTNPDLKVTLSCSLARPGTAHGIAIWFDATLVEPICFSGAPGATELIYGQAFFPLAQPIDLMPGDQITLTLQAILIRGNYTWNWRTTVTQPAEGDRVKAQLNQSTFYSAPLSLPQLQKQSPQHIPTRNQRGQISQMILGAMDGTASLETITDRVLHQFPDQFQNWQEAFNLVSELTLQYSE